MAARAREAKPAAAFAELHEGGVEELIVGAGVGTTDEIAILLHGRNQAANRHRAWRVEAGLDLFGKWSVRVSFGRIGCRGRALAREFASEKEARNYVREGLRRRRSALRRCEVDYLVVEASPAAAPLVAASGLSPIE